MLLTEVLLDKVRVLAHFNALSLKLVMITSFRVDENVEGVHPRC